MLSEVVKRIIEQNPTEFPEYNALVQELQETQQKQTENKEKIGEKTREIDYYKRNLSYTTVFQIKKRRDFNANIALAEQRRDELDKERTNLAEKILELQQRKKSIEEQNPIILISKIGEKQDQEFTIEECRAISSYFGNDFMQFVNFCNSNGILIDLSYTDNFLQFLYKEYSVQKQPEKEDKRIDSFDGLYLVRKCKDTYPKGDMLVCGSKEAKTEPSWLEVDGEKVEYEAPAHHATIHWCINQEVMPHKDAKIGWVDSNVIIIQPLTETIYNQMAALNPIDSFNVGYIKLENYFVICTSEEIAKQIKENNPTATPICITRRLDSLDKVYTPIPMDKNVKCSIINGVGNLLMNMLQSRGPYYKLFNPGVLDNRVPLTSYYTEEFLKNHPKFSRVYQSAVCSPEHRMLDFVRDIACSKAVLEHRIKSEKIRKLDDIFKSWSNRGTITSLDKKMVDIFPDALYEDAKILDGIFDLDLQCIKRYIGSIDRTLEVPIAERATHEEFNALMEYILKDCNITNENKENYKRLKIYFIMLFEKWKEGPDGGIIGSVYQFKKIANSQLMDLEIDPSFVPEIPIEYQDYTDLIEHITSNLDLQGTFEDKIWSAFGIADNKKVFNRVQPVSVEKKEEDERSLKIKSIINSLNPSVCREKIVEMVNKYLEGCVIKPEDKRLYADLFEDCSEDFIEKPYEKNRALSHMIALLSIKYVLPQERGKDSQLAEAKERRDQALSTNNEAKNLEAEVAKQLEKTGDKKVGETHGEQ